MKHTVLYSLIVALSLSNFSVNALEKPLGGPSDERVRFVDFDPSDVTMIIGHYGFSTHIQFNESEEIVNIATGDTSAWDIAPVGNHLFVKPVAMDAETNMTVITNARVYNFELDAHWSQAGAHPEPQDMFFQVNFLYPEEQARLAAYEFEAAQLEFKLNQQDDMMNVNWNYWAKGALDVTPNEAYDNGNFTFLTFANNKEIPAIYVVNLDGTESLVNTSIDSNSPDTVIVHTTARQLTLRNGNNVVCIFNENFDPNGTTNFSGTTAPGVERIIRGAQI